MLAKTVLEEKNELLDNMARVIADLRAREKRLEKDLAELKGELRGIRERALQEGIRNLVEEVVLLADACGHGKDSADGFLAQRLIRLFQERYGLEIIEGDCSQVDPLLHQVIEVLHCPGQGSSVQVQARGFRLRGRLIRPALVKVLQGTREQE